MCVCVCVCVCATLVGDLHSNSDQQESTSVCDPYISFIYYGLNKTFNKYIYLFTENNYHLSINVYFKK